MLFIVWGLLMLGCIAVYFIAESFERRMKGASVAQATRDAYKRAAGVAQARGEFELYDTEGRSNQRLERARIAHEISLELLSLIGKRENKTM